MFLRLLLVIFVISNIAIIISGKLFVYKALYYNFANIDDNSIFEQRIIEKAPKVQPWPKSNHYNKTDLSSKLAAFHKNNKTVAFAVIKNDSLLHEEYFEGKSAESRTNSFSMAKTVVSILIGVAIKEGKIKSEEDFVGKYLPEFNMGKLSKVKIKHLLTMSSGLSWDESYANPLSMTTEAYYGTDLWALMLRLYAKETPGKYFKYLSGDTQVLAFILMKATGKSLSAYASEKLWQPMGAEHAAEWSLDKKDGIEKAYCCIYSNVTDFARFGNLYLHQGNWKGKQLVDSNYVLKSITPANLIDEETNNKIDYYGYKWWLIPNYKGEKIFYARGILGQFVIVIPSKNIVIARLGDKVPKKINNHYQPVFDLIDAVLE